MIKSIFTLFLLLIVQFEVLPQKLGRRAFLGASVSSPSANRPGAVIRSVEDNSPLQKAGIQEGDRILKVDEVLASSGEEWSNISYGLRADQPTQFLVKRGEEVLTPSVQLEAWPKETHDGLDTYYEEVISDFGITQRMIITKPNKRGRQPALILIGGLSCSSVELHPTRTNNWQKTIKDLVEKTGMVMMRIEKPGVGDSDGDCGTSDFITDLSGYHAAIRALKVKDYVDTTNIIIYGSSMGSALAPYLANEHGLAGVISDGTFFKTWFEHMLEIERRIRQMSGDSESEIAEKLNKYYIPLYYKMMIEKKSYQEAVDEYPALAEYNYHSPEHMYGRPMAYYQQLQDFDLASGWENLQVPLRIMRGSNDWIMSAYDNQMIMDLLNRKGHEDHVLFEKEGMDHWNTIHERPDDSFLGNPGEWDDEISGKFVRWARELAGLE
ncbi:MAG: PDZ domain-containing protein [Cyclobacteriaceae bacterium]